MNLFKDLPDAKTYADMIERGEYEAAKTEAENISVLIKKAVKEGRRSICVGNIQQTVKNALEGKGYTVRYFSDQRDQESNYTISW